VKEANREVLDRGSLGELLVTRARQSSDRRLVIDAGAGLVGAAVLAILRPPFWVSLTALAFCLGAFGLWGILDREATESVSHGAQRRIVAWSRLVVAIAGGLAAAVFGISLFFSMLGQWIS
jgi:hypothetical protein